MWFYSENGEQRGPVSESDVANLRSQGVIRPDTLVWREGQSGWLPCSTVFGMEPSLSTPPPPPEPLKPGESRCSQCGRVFPESDVIRYGQASVCAECKPTFVQKLKEGVAIQSASMEYVGFGLRFVAKFLDGIIGALIGTVVSYFVVPILNGTMSNSGSATLHNLKVQGMVAGINFVVGLVFNTFFLVKFGATLGKMAVKIKVVRSDGSPIGLGTAIARPFAEIVSALILYIGYFMILWDPECRSLHDRLCDTRVIRKK